MARLRDHAQAFTQGLTAVGSSAAVLKRVEVDDEGICVTVTLERGGRASGLTLIFEDGYPKGCVVATSDDASDDARVSSLNSAINGWKGITLTLFDALRMIGSAFGVGGEVQAALDASGAEQQQQQHRAEAAAKGKAKSKAASDGDDDDEDEGSDGGGYPDSDDYDDDEDDEDDAQDNKLNSDQLTRLYQNKRKVVEREERRVQQKTAALEESKASMTWDMKQAARNQIFSPEVGTPYKFYVYRYTEGAFARLSSELFALQERLDPALGVDAVNYDVYEWDVKFRGGFPAGSGLTNDLEMLEAGLYET